MKNNFTFGIHPSEKLQKLYNSHYYQGASPESAKFLFIGRDANWKIDIDQDPIFPKVIEYLEDGVQFWKRHKIHHPFLLDEYKGDGRRYHKMFSKIGLSEQNKNHVSFIELLKYPTYGMAGKNRQEFLTNFLSPSNSFHLQTLDNLFKDESKIIFIAWGLVKDIKDMSAGLNIFEKIKRIDMSKLDINTVNSIENIHIHKHFSDSISNDTITKMKSIIEKNL
jgi:hypothetical protein